MEYVEITYGTPAVTRRFRVEWRGYAPSTDKHMNMRMSVNGKTLLTVGRTPEVIRGVFLIGSGDAEPYGTVSDLRQAFSEAVVTMRLHDGSVISGTFVGSMQRRPLDPRAIYVEVPFQFVEVF